MADTKISAATAVVTPAATDEYPTNQGGASKKTTRAQMHSLGAGEQLSIDDGTEAAPGLRFATDTDTGIFQNAAGELAVSVNGNEVITVSGTSMTLLPEETSVFSIFSGYSNRGKVSIYGNANGNGDAVVLTSADGHELTIENNSNDVWDFTINKATGNEVCLSLNPTINKATSGDVIGLRVNTPTFTSAPGKYTALEMDMVTRDNAFINFKATADADATSAISTLTTSGAVTHHIQIEINGTTAWIPCSTTDPS